MDNKNIIYNLIVKYMEVVDKSHLVLPQKSVFEIYHHYGLENGGKIGALFVNVVNREYCKSYAVVLPGQQYPSHYHKIKLETFYVLYGDLNVSKEDNIYHLHPGEMLDVERLEEHSFSSKTGCVLEEISTTYVRNDSIYTDSNISKQLYDNRKTIVTFKEWEGMINGTSKII